MKSAQKWLLVKKVIILKIKIGMLQFQEIFGYNNYALKWI